MWIGRDTGPFGFLFRKFGFDYAWSVPHLLALPNFLSIVVIASDRQPLKSDPVEDLFEVASFRKLDWLKEGRHGVEYTYPNCTP